MQIPDSPRPRRALHGSQWSMATDELWMLQASAKLQQAAPPRAGAWTPWSAPPTPLAPCPRGGGPELVGIRGFLLGTRAGFRTAL